jgi:hypothetical protein
VNYAGQFAPKKILIPNDTSLATVNPQMFSTKVTKWIRRVISASQIFVASSLRG